MEGPEMVFELTEDAIPSILRQRTQATSFRRPPGCQEIAGRLRREGNNDPGDRTVGLGGSTFRDTRVMAHYAYTWIIRVSIDSCDEQVIQFEHRGTR